MRILLTLLLVFACAQQAALAETMLVMVDGYCYLEGQSEHSETKVKFIKDSPSAITDSTYTDSSGYFFISDLYAGIYDVEYTHAGFDTVVVENQLLVGPATLPPVTLQKVPCELSGQLHGILGPDTCHILDNIYVDSGDTLILLPGTVFIFDGPYLFEIFGTLLAEGTESDSIIFTTDQSGGNRWTGFDFDPGSDGSQLSYCVIEKGNATNDGGGIYCNCASPTFTHCSIRENSSGANGGGVDCYGTPSPSFTNCTVTGNSSGENGGGVYCSASSPVLANCTISGNTATSYDGGGVFCHNSSSPAFINCTIAENSTERYGGGLLCYSSSPIFTNCTINGNWAENGGAAYITVNSSPHFANCRIRGNSADWGGGGIRCDQQSSATLANCILIGNSATYGGAVYCRDLSYPTLTSCTLSGNSASSGGGGAYIRSSFPTFISSIIAFSDGSGIYFDNSSGSQISYCDFLGNSAGDFGGNGPAGIGQLVTNNANGDPCDVYRNIFLNPMFADTAAGDFHLLDNSHCIGAGDSEDTVSTDFEGDPRPNPPGSFPDIGADENLNAQPPVGPCELSGPLGGQCILGPGVCHVIGEISVSAGESLILLPGTTLIFDGPYPFNIYGTLLAEGTESDSIVFTTDTLQNPDRWRGLHFLSGSDSSRLSYCLIERSQAVGDWPDNNGGGIYCSYSSPTLTNCTIAENSAGGGGGGLACREFASPTFTSCTFVGNSAGIYGGGAYCYLQCSPLFTNCVFHQNSASTHGGGAYAGYMCSPTFTNCAMSENSATSYGGGAFSDNYSSPVFSSCTIIGNSASFGGGAYSYGGSSPSFNNCLIDDNSASGRGGGVYGGYLSSPTLTHCTISRNSAGTFGGGMVCFQASLILSNSIIAFSNGSGIYFQGGSGGQALYCDIFGNSDGNIRFLNDDPSQGPPAIGLPVTINANADSADIYLNIFVDPMFADTAAGDFHLTDLSHCIGAGDPAIAGADFEGDPRPNPSGSNPDIGMDENPHGAAIPGLVISVDNGNAVLKWLPFGVSGTVYNIYGSTLPFVTGTLLHSTTNTDWTDEETASRPWRYFYYVTAEWPGR